MKLIKLHLLVAAMIIVTSGCVGSGKKYKQQENSAAGVVDSKNKDCYGTYEGILPCADCGGIKTTLKINSDATYDLRSEYLGEENGIFAKLNELSMVDLEAHLERKTVSVIAQQLKGIPHLVVIKIGIAAVRSANDSGYTSPLGSLEHRQALIEIGGAVVYTRQDMAMNVTHRSALIN